MEHAQLCSVDYTLPVFTGRDQGCHFGHPWTRPVNTGSVYRPPLPVQRRIYALLASEENNVPVKAKFNYAS